MSNEAFLGTSIDNPPGLVRDYESNLGKATACVRMGHRIPYDIARALMEDGIDVPALAASQPVYAEENQ